MNLNIQNSNEEMQLELDFEFHAPIDLVFEVLTKPEHIRHWHSPNHLDITFAENTLEVGGEYRIGVTVVGGDGTEMMFIGKYVEINPPDRLVYTQTFSPGNDAPLTSETKITIDLKQEGNRTLMNFLQTGFTQKQALAGAKRSWPEAYAKLGAYLETL